MIIKGTVLVGIDGLDITIGKVVIPDNVMEIGDFAFFGCKGLTSINIPNNVTNIGRYAFFDCSGLTSVTIGSGVKRIGDFAFSNCINLKRITIPDNVISIGGNAFFKCRRLVTNIKAYKAFKIIKNDVFKCRDKIYCPGQLYRTKGALELCTNGIHYCTNLFEIFDYYSGEIDKSIAIFEIKTGSNILKSSTSKCCTSSCRLVKRLYRKDVINILNGVEVEE